MHFDELDLKAYKGLIFDLDGTLIDSMPWHVRAWKQVCHEHGFDIDPNIVYQLGGMASRNIAQKFKDEGKNVGSVDAFVQRKIDLYRENLSQIKLFEPVFALMQRAHAAGLKCAIGTGTQRINAEDIVEKLHLTPYVQAIVSSDDVSAHKPNPDTFLKAAELLGLQPEDCLVLDDGPVGLEAARRAKMDCVEVLNGTMVRLIHNH